MTTTETLLAMLEELRGLDPDLGGFGASTHGYALNPPLTETALANFERENSIVLPAAYREFLLEAGDGGAGPGYGLQPLAPWHCEGFSEVTSVVTTKSGERFEAGTAPRARLERLSDPAKPYPFTEAWSAPVEGETLPIPEDSHPFDGCLYLAELGCGYGYFLVVTGEAAGQIWVDYSAGDGQISKVADDFAIWYRQWLEESLITAAEAAAFNALWYNPGEPPHEAVVNVLSLVDAVSEENPDWGGQHYLRGVLCMYNRDVDPAIAALERSIELYPDNLRPRVMLGRLYHLLQEYPTALSVAEAGSAVPGWGDVENREKLCWLRAWSLLALERGPEALEAAAQARDLLFYSFRTQIDYAILAIRMGQPQVAEAAIEEYIEKGHEDGEEASFRSEVYQVMVEACTAWELPEMAEAYQRKLMMG